MRDAVHSIPRGAIWVKQSAHRAPSLSCIVTMWHFYGIVPLLTYYKLLLPVLSVARELESHISSFAARVEGRRQILESAVLFYSHVEEVKNHSAFIKETVALVDKFCW